MYIRYKINSTKFVLLTIIGLITLSACENESLNKEQEHFLQSYELGGPNGKDTMNVVDAHGYKQGLWIMRNRKDTMVYKNDTGYSTKGYTFGEVVRMLKAGHKGPFVSYDSLAVKSKL